MNRSLISLALITSIIMGCETVVDIDIPLEPPMVVINSTLVNDQFISVNLSKSQHILDGSEYNFIQGATVDIFENNQYLTTLPDSLQGNYISSSVKAKRGATYKIEVSKNGFETANAQVLIPLDTVDVLSVKMDTLIENEFGYTSYYLRFSVEFKDDIEADNFYDISIHQGGYYQSYDYSVDPPLLLDSTYFYNKLYIQSRDPSLEEFQSYGQNIQFSDELFNGNTYHMNVLVPTWFDYENPNLDEAGWTYYITLRNTSKSYYLYELSSSLQYWTSDNPFAQPVTVYNNIENGFGVFGAYNTAVYKVE